jgi:hypothetical protein
MTMRVTAVTILSLLYSAGCVGGDPLEYEDLRESDNLGKGQLESDPPADTGSGAAKVPCGNGECCMKDGIVYQWGETVQIPCDNCENACVCVQHDAKRASWDCTACECQKACEYGGATYRPGEEFMATDGCNVCECQMVNSKGRS